MVTIDLRRTYRLTNRLTCNNNADRLTGKGVIPGNSSHKALREKVSGKRSNFVSVGVNDDKTCQYGGFRGRYGVLS